MNVKKLKISIFVLLMLLFPTINNAQNFSFEDYLKLSSDTVNFSDTLNNEDYFGSSIANLGDLNGDGIDDIAVGAINDDEGGTNRGAVYILFLDTNNSVKSYQKIAHNMGGFGALDNGDAFGSSIANIGDLNGDGIIDIAVGTVYDDDGGTDRGAVYILFLDTNGTLKSYQKISDTAGDFTGVIASNSLFGSAACGLGDLDGDGINDIAVGSMKDQVASRIRGAVWILFLDTNGTVKSHTKISINSGGFSGYLGMDTRFGASLATIGDLNEDGVVDIAVGANRDADGGLNRGAIWILFMKSDGTVLSHQKISDTAGGFSGTIDSLDLFGSSISSLGDFDGDGNPDLLVGAPLDDDGGADRGALWLLYLKLDGTVKENEKICDTLSAFSGVVSNGDSFGQSVATINNLQQNGEINIAVGAPFDDDGGVNRGAIYLLGLALLQEDSNNIFINTISISDSITYNFEFRGDSASYTTKSMATMLIDNVDTTHTAKITVEATDSFGALTLLFDVNEVQISNVRAVIFSMGATDTLALDSNLYKISNNGQTLTLYQRDTNEVDADSLLYGLVLQGGLGFSPNNDGVYDELAISGLANINQFELTIKDLSDNVVFTTTDKSEFWNGKYMGDGELVPTGTYNYILEVNGDTLEGQILLDY